MLSPDECLIVINEARSNLRPRANGTYHQGCSGWRVHQRSATAKLIGERNFPLDAQVVRYGPGDGYAWHTDGAARGMTEVTLLSDPDDFVGGGFEFKSRNSNVPLQMKQGIPIRFDAQLEHQVAEVTEGERWTLVVWEPRKF